MRKISKTCWVQAWVNKFNSDEKWKLNMELERCCLVFTYQHQTDQVIYILKQATQPVTQKNSNYFTLREYWLSGNHQIKVKQWHCYKRCAAQGQESTLVLLKTFLSACILFSQSPFRFVCFDFFFKCWVKMLVLLLFSLFFFQYHQCRRYCRYLCSNYFQINIPVIVRTFFPIHSRLFIL